MEASGEFITLVNTLYGTATSDNERTDHIVRNFYLAATGVEPTAAQIQAERDVLNTAAAQGVGQVQAALESFGRSLFAGQVSDPNITNQQFVTNLYEGFLQRGPDAAGLNFWSSGSKQWALDGMASSIAFHELAATLYRESFWLVTDHLGTPRMVVDKSGSSAGVKRHDYLPFGEEIHAGLGGRTTGQGYVGDTVRQHFTGYEYDSESALNFAQARYQSPSQGRFTSVDPLGASATIGDPQSFNRYSYVQNNPINFTDPTGMMLWDIGVYQTSNPEVVRKIERAEDQGVKNWIASRGTQGSSSGWAAAKTKEVAAQRTTTFFSGLVETDKDSSTQQADVDISMAYYISDQRLDVTRWVKGKTDRFPILDDSFTIHGVTSGLDNCMNDPYRAVR